MKKLFFACSIALFIGLTSCNDSGDKKAGSVSGNLKAQADSLENEVLKGHDITMPKSMKIPDLQQNIKRLIDSIDKLPAKAKEAASSYKAQLQSMDKELGDAYTSMDNWMEAFGQRMQELNSDSLKTHYEEKVKYYSQEKLKIDKIKDAVLGSVQKADSLLKAKF